MSEDTKDKETKDSKTNGSADESSEAEAKSAPDDKESSEEKASEKKEASSKTEDKKASEKKEEKKSEEKKSEKKASSKKEEKKKDEPPPKKWVNFFPPRKEAPHAPEIIRESKPAVLLAEFDTAARLVHAAERMRDAGYTKWDTHSPFPIHGMDAAMGIPDSKQIGRAHV